jgi:hypothetical protein
MKKSRKGRPLRKTQIFQILAFALLAAAIILNVFGLKRPSAADQLADPAKDAPSAVLSSSR